MMTYGWLAYRSTECHKRPFLWGNHIRIIDDESSRAVTVAMTRTLQKRTPSSWPVSKATKAKSGDHGRNQIGTASGMESNIGDVLVEMKVQEIVGNQ